MLYGRRVIEPQRSIENAGTISKHFIINKSFQQKYSWYMVTAIAGGALLFLIPAYHFLAQNYELFKTLAYDTQPALVQHLEREVMWLKVFLGLAFVSITGATLFLSLKMTKNLMSPLDRIEKHMYQLMLGKWNIPDYQMFDQDDFRDLAMTYDYFYRSLKANTEAELKLLTKLSIDPQNREGYAAWKQLINSKRSRLGIDDGFISNENVASMNVFDRKHRAS